MSLHTHSPSTQVFPLILDLYRGLCGRVQVVLDLSDLSLLHLIRHGHIMLLFNEINLNSALKKDVMS